MSNGVEKHLISEGIKRHRFFIWQYGKRIAKRKWAEWNKYKAYVTNQEVFQWQN